MQDKKFSYKEIFSTGIKRKIALQKKRDRFFIDKTISELKIKLDISIINESSVEFFVIEDKYISISEYDSFKESKYLDKIEVESFDDKLWEKHSTIEPTKQMKEYKKIKL